MKKQFLSGAVWIALGGLIAKGIGALFHLPFINLLGGYGVGVYELVYPVYAVLVTLTGAGVSGAMSKTVAQSVVKNQPKSQVLKTGLTVFMQIGFIGSVGLLLLAFPMSLIQKNKMLAGYFYLAPAVVFSCGIAVFRGYYQGQKEMRPTAISLVGEEAVKAVLGTAVLYLFKNDTLRAVRGLFIVVTLTEIITFFSLFFFYKKSEKTSLRSVAFCKPIKKQLFSLAQPVSFASAILPVVGILESVVFLKALGGSEQCVCTYGLFSGCAMSVINLPVSLCYGLAVSSVPEVAERMAKGETSNARKRIFYCLKWTALCSLVSAVGLYFFSPLAVRLLFSSLSVSEQKKVVLLIRVLLVSEIFSSLTQTLSACLTALGRAKKVLTSTLISAVVRFCLSVVLLVGFGWDIGIAVSADVGYLVAFSVNLWYNLRSTKKEKKDDDYGGGTRNEAGGFDDCGQRSVIKRKTCRRQDGKYPFV